MRFGKLSSAAFGFIAIVASGNALAQQNQRQQPVQSGQPAAPSPQADQPQMTTASFGDWVLRCVATENAGQRRRTCEVVQTLMAQGQSAPFAQLAFGVLSPGGPLQMTSVLPINVSLATPVRVALDDKGQQQIDLAWTRCVPSGCFATGTPTPDVLKAWKSATENGRVAVVDGANRQANLPISFRGLGAALDAMAKEK